MDSCRGYGSSSDMLALLDNSSNSLWVHSSPSFHETMVNFDQEIQHQGRRPSPKLDRQRSSDGEDMGGEDFDMSPFHHTEKKRRLTAEQVQFLEKNFEVENKLEPERKVQLAKELGLQPRQVAIWFQNRRARYKTKQLEKDYDSLKANYDKLKDDYDTLIKEKEDLQNEVKLLTKKLKHKDLGWANMDPDSPNNPPYSDPYRENMTKMETEKLPNMEMFIAPKMKQIEDASSAKSDVFDSESPHCTEGIHSSHILDPDMQSDFSQDEEDQGLMMSKNFLLPSTTTYNNVLNKVEEGCFDDANGTSCNFSLVDDQPFWSLLY